MILGVLGVFHADVVEELAVLHSAYIFLITTEDQPGFFIVEDDVVLHHDAASHTALVLRPHFDAEIALGDDVVLDDDVHATVHIDARAVAAFVGGPAAEDAVAFANAVAADLMANPVSADELQRAVEPTKQAIERAASGNSFWLNQLKGATYDPERFVALGKLYSDYNDVTPAILQALAQRYFIKDKAWKLVVAPQSGDAAVSAAR